MWTYQVFRYSISGSGLAIGWALVILRLVSEICFSISFVFSVVSVYRELQQRDTATSNSSLDLSISLIDARADKIERTKEQTVNVRRNIHKILQLVRTEQTFEQTVEANVLEGSTR